jgi:hydroxymethylglutaryl-CoA lyase
MYKSVKLFSRNYSFPSRVKIYEVGPRDGLQNESMFVPTNIKIDFINKLSNSGLTDIEATSFVSPKWVPQMADADKVYRGIKKKESVRYPVLVPNIQGLKKAMEAGVKDIAVFIAASETFSNKNINCTIQESIERYQPVIKEALSNGIGVRGYLSCVAGCPYEGDISEIKVAQLCHILHTLGCYEISLGDTIGVGTPVQIKKILSRVLEAQVPKTKIAVHYHNTYGQALANILASLEMGISIVDSSCGGLGGCPYALGASGNVSTEDVLYMLNGMGIETGVDLKKLIHASKFIYESLKKENQSRVATALLSKEEKIAAKESVVCDPPVREVLRSGCAVM